MRTDRTPPPGLCSLQTLPDPYQLAFRQGSAHYLPGQFLPVNVDWFTQILLLPLWLLIYALPPLTLPIAFINQWIRAPESYGRFFRTVQQQNAVETAIMVGLFGLIGVLLVYSAWVAWDAGSSFVRTWQAHRWQRRGDHGFGLVLLEQGLVARLIDNLDGYNCLWLPRDAIADILWQRIREEGAKRSRWVYRTRLCYVTTDQGKPQTRWLTLKGYFVQTDYPVGDVRSDRALFEQLHGWWRSPASTHLTAEP
ncbi:hypothetical protein [Spirulina major]|uniref:hypothetical protein n=1 Tax=Spirulina major TaxID=270636 RepID=UPI0009342C8C|nr:hypothetical protein [Spirulina major]